MLGHLFTTVTMLDGLAIIEINRKQKCVTNIFLEKCWLQIWYGICFNFHCTSLTHSVKILLWVTP